MKELLLALALDGLVELAAEFVFVLVEAEVDPAGNRVELQKQVHGQPPEVRCDGLLVVLHLQTNLYAFLRGGREEGEIILDH